MSYNFLNNLFLFLQGLIILAIAPLIIGWINKIKCWLQNRSSPSILLPYYEIRKLFFKQPVLASNASWLFRSAPYVYFSCLTFLCFTLPFINIAGLASAYTDIIVITGILALARTFLALAAMDVGTAFGSMGTRREMLVACLAEPVLLIIFLNVALISQAIHLNIMSQYFIGHFTLHPSLMFSLLALIMVILAETGRVPIDNPATHLELTMIHEAMTIEYSGRYLALLEWGNAVKFTLYLLLMNVLFIPYGLSSVWNIQAVAISFIAICFKLFLFSTLIGCIESINAKIRIFKIPEYLAAAFMLAVLGVILTQLFGANI